MPYIIDGHNLIPKIAGMSLEEIDDEIHLVKMLQEFCRIRRKQVQVYFDNAPPGTPSARNYGSVVAHFIREGRTADQAIREKLKRLGGEARNWSVVSSDQEVKAAARAARAMMISAEDFVKQLVEALRETGIEPSDSERGLSNQEVEEWMQVFGVEEQDEDKE